MSLGSSVRLTDCRWSSLSDLPCTLGNTPLVRIKSLSDALGVEIEGVLSQENHLVIFFSEKLNKVKLRYSTYDKELYVVVQDLRHWRQIFDDCY